VGLDESEIKTFLESDIGTKEVENQKVDSIERSIGAVPTYIINDQYLIQGGQQPETFMSFLRRIQLKEQEKQNAK